jgi:hypothetical protein
VRGKNLFDLRYVFDCGSEHQDSFRRSLQQFRSDHPGLLDILFVSHLHADHINGIDRLLGYEAPRIVILPYLALEDIAAIALKDFEEGRFSGSYRDYLRDPVLWWRDRGVETIIFIEPGTDDGIAPESPTPDQPIEGGDLSPPEGEPQKPLTRLAAILQKPQGPVDSELTPADPNVRVVPKANLLAGSGSIFRLEWKYNDADAWRSGDWFLVPYVHRVEQAARAEFRKTVLKHLKLRRPAPKKFRARLLEELTSTDRAKALVDIYSEYFGGNHNVVSLSLYSGPGQSEREYRDSNRAWRMWESHARLGVDREYWGGHVSAGWMRTVFDLLMYNKRRLPWRQFFSRYQENIGVLTLPHHGSINNFHEDVIEWNGLRLVLATTVEAEARVARIRETLQFVAAKRQTGHVVDDQLSSTVVTESQRIFGP